MLKSRVIPCLLLKGEGLVKTTRFRKPVYVGDPINTIKIFNEKEVDEIVVLDIGASKDGKPPNFKKIEEITSECFMPMCYGGGIRTLEDAERIFASGVEKISLQTSVLGNFSLIEQVARKFGTSSVVVSVDLKKSWTGGHKIHNTSGSARIPKKWTDFIANAINSGAGEIFLNSVDRDGTMGGMDIGIIEEAATKFSVPLIAAGGVGSLADIKAAKDAGASAVSAGAFFVFHGPHRAVLISYPKYKTLQDLFE